MSKTMKYLQAIDGEWVRLAWKNQKECCCGCGLVHVVSYKVIDGELFAKFTVDKRATAAIRRHKK